MKSPQQSRYFLYGLSIFSFIPLIGVIIGAIFIIIGLFTKFKDKYLVIIGVGGILFSVILYSVISYNSYRDRDYINSISIQSVKQGLTIVVKDLEYYKIQNSCYPDSLSQLVTDESIVYIVDPMQLDKKGRGQRFYYQLVDSGYYLFSVGVDGVPFTRDDIFPNISENEAMKIGLRKPRIY